MKKTIVFFIGIFLILPLAAQNSYKGRLSFTGYAVSRNGQNIEIDYNIVLDDISLNSDKMITLVPAVVSDDSSHFRRLAPITITGKSRAKYTKRAVSLGNHSFEFDVSNMVVRKNNTKQQIPLQIVVQYEDWMLNASIIIDEVITGCVGCQPVYNRFKVAQQLLPPIFKPQYQLAYVLPQPEPIKQRNEDYTVHLSFKVGESDLLLDYMDNATELAQVDKIISDIKTNRFATINHINITGYASPEGNYQNNMKLSENRARAFADYLRNRYQFKPDVLRVDWRGEDWVGLRKAVSLSSFEYSKQVLKAIDIPDVNQRKAKIRSLSDGTTYKFLLDKYYPPLRRIEYRLSYVVSFSLDEARELIKTNPKLLSLNEMYLVANSYQKGSREFKDVFDIAARLYPHDKAASLNAGTAELEAGAVDIAISRLSVLDSPEALNNIAIAYIEKKMYDKAASCFKQASAKGLGVAETNLQKLTQWMHENNL